jgi:TolA-binding protein
MKFWKYLLLIPFLTTTLSAQIPSFGGYAYPQPYPPLWAYPLDRISAPNDDAIDALTQQVQQLNEEIRQLQAELAAAQAQAQQAQQAQQALTRSVQPPPGPAGPETVLVFKNGQKITSQGYAIAGDTLWALTPSGSERIAISSLDLRATQRANLQRGIQFPDLGK